jgi:hypothetical protein
MKKEKILTVISIICILIGFYVFTIALIMGIRGINAHGWDGLLVLLIPPSIIGLLIEILDFLTVINVFKKKFIWYSYVSSIIKIIIIIVLLSIVYESEAKQLILFFIIITIPSIINIKRLKNRQ